MSTDTLGHMDPESWAAVQELPLARPPPGVTPNFLNPIFNGHHVLIAGCIALILVSVAAIIRIYIKWTIMRKITVDDYIYMISWPSGVAIISLQIAIMMGGAYGHHAWDVQIKDLTTPVLLRSLVLTVVTGPLQWLGKLTLFSLILTAFAPLRFTRALVFIGILVSGIMYVSCAMTLGMICGPANGGTDHQAYLTGMAGKACSSTTGAVPKVNIMLGATSILVDFYIFMLPLPAVWTLKLERKRKLGIYAVFMVAFGACITSIVSMYFRTKHLGSEDITWVMTPFYITVICETAMGLIIPCSVYIAKFYRHFFCKMSTTTPTSEKDSNSRRKKQRAMGQDEVGLFSTQASEWNKLSSISSKTTDSMDKNKSFGMFPAAQSLREDQHQPPTTRKVANGQVSN